MPLEQIDPSVPPSGDGCVECMGQHGWWLHLRRCALCGHVGCCDSSPSQHASRHARATGHAVVQSFEPGEEWFWDYQAHTVIAGTDLTPPSSHPPDQPVPGPEGRVPSDWERQLH